MLFVVTGIVTVTGIYIVAAAGTVHVCCMAMAPTMAAFVSVLSFLRKGMRGAAELLLGFCQKGVKKGAGRGGNTVRWGVSSSIMC